MVTPVDSSEKGSNEASERIPRSEYAEATQAHNDSLGGNISREEAVALQAAMAAEENKTEPAPLAETPVIESAEATDAPVLKNTETVVVPESSSKEEPREALQPESSPVVEVEQSPEEPVTEASPTLETEPSVEAPVVEVESEPVSPVSEVVAGSKPPIAEVTSLPDEVPIAEVTSQVVTRQAAAAPNPHATGRHHYMFLEDFSGFFLVRYDENAKILGFFGGAVRMSSGPQETTTYIYDQRYMFDEGAMRGRQPAPEVCVYPKGQRPQQMRISLSEDARYTEHLLRVAPAEVSAAWDRGRWGILSVNLKHGKKFSADKPNCFNTEDFISDSNWSTASGNQTVIGSGGADLAGRLSPHAVAIAQSLPTAWALVNVPCFYIGGMTQGLPNLGVAEMQAIQNLAHQASDTLARHRERYAEKRAAGAFSQHHTNAGGGNIPSQVFAQIDAAMVREPSQNLVGGSGSSSD